jgi:NAD(P)-dependent dehydrogenase (short-subunit alcohol dehydrogenase family)
MSVTDTLAGHSALVTGATSGIGKAVAIALASRGALVVVHGRDKERADAVVARIRGAGGRAEAVTADLASGPDAARDLAAAATAAAGRIDVLVNNAAVLIPAQSMLEVTDEQLAGALAVNVAAPIVLTAALVPGMRERGHGVVVNLGSIVGSVGFEQAALYGASKAALHSLTKSWAAELAGAGVRVNTVAPGPTATEDNGAFATELAELTRRYPDGRPGTASEVAEAVAFLAGPGAAHIHGATIPVDGGAAAI